LSDSKILFGDSISRLAAAIETSKEGKKPIFNFRDKKSYILFVFWMISFTMRISRTVFLLS
jgi:hypothetical protein